MRVLVPLALFGLASCSLQDTECEPAPRALIGELAVDILGTYGDFGIDSPVYFTFLEGGDLRMVESPNRYAPRGFIVDWTWSIEGDRLTFDYGDGNTQVLGVEVAPARLTTTMDPDTEAAFEQEHPRLRCWGYGFE